MKRLLTITLFTLVAASCWGQHKWFKLGAYMNGMHTLASGNTMPAWGYGWDSLYPYYEVPAPLLEVNQGDSVTVQFTNYSPEAHTIHLHGLDADQANDGVPATSFFVWNGDSAAYSFNANYPGTYLYHCHVTTTLHLTLGMYGMLLVNRPDKALYNGGPHYARQYPLLTSDVDSTINPLSPPELHKLTPNYFMVNGKSKHMLSSDTIFVTENDNTALSLANIAYAKVEYIFPPSLQAEVFMSDGRPLNQSFITDSLELYPGERYSVILSTDQYVQDFILVKYYNMVSGELKHINRIPVNTQYLSIADNELPQKIKVVPNPFTQQFRIEGIKPHTYLQVFDMLGKELEILSSTRNNATLIGTASWPKGIYFLYIEGKTVKLVKQ